MSALHPLFASLLALSLGATAAMAAWPTDPSINLPVCTVDGNASMPHVCADGAGGFIVIWQDYRNWATLKTDLYAQRVAPDGTMRWTADGVPICALATYTYASWLAPDGAGGAFLAWEDSRPGAANTFVQRVDSTGASLWAAGGVPVSSPRSKMDESQICPDGLGGLLVAWTEHYPSTAYNNAYVQRVNSTGQVQWSTGSFGVGVLADSGGHVAGVVADGAGGVYVGTTGAGGTAWGNVRVQHMSPAGVRLWGVHGVKVSGQPVAVSSATMIPDGTGGMILVWGDKRVPATPTASYELYAQRINAAGAPQWAADGVPVCVAPAAAIASLVAVSDGAGGVVVCWSDSRTWTGSDLYAQHVDGAGNALWTASGAPACAGPEQMSRRPAMARTTAGDYFIAWSDSRDNWDEAVYAQLLAPDGSPRWAVGGIPIATAPYEQRQSAVLADDSGGAFVVWSDNRRFDVPAYTVEYDLYAQRVTASGQLGTVGVAPGPGVRGIALAPASRIPARGPVSLVLSLERDADVRLDVLDLAGRRIARLVDGMVPAGQRRFTWDGRDGRGTEAPPGLYMVRASTPDKSVSLRIVRLR